MRRFLVYFLGVIAGLVPSLVEAVEKFEILPDLPESLAYVAPPAQAATVSGATDLSTMANHSIGNEPSIVSVILSLIFVVLLIYLTGIIYAKLNKVGFKTLKRQQGDFARNQVSVISTTQLGNNKTLHVVELDGKRMLIGASSSAIQLIKDLGTIDDKSLLSGEYSHIEIPSIKIPKIEIPKIEIPSIKFSKHPTKTHKPIDEIEKLDVENEINETVEIVEENQEGIIDSLFTQINDTESENITEPVKSEHIVDPDDYALYKKYLN